jgi:hypothetical protein
MQKIFVTALTLLPVSGLANDFQHEQELEVQTYQEEQLEVPLEAEFSFTAFSTMPCGDANLSNFYEEAKFGFDSDRNKTGGLVTLKSGPTQVTTRFADVICPDGFPVIQFQNGGSIRITSYFGSWLPSPTWGAVQAYQGSINIPGVFAIDNVKFWFTTTGNLFGFLLTGPEFNMSSKWMVLN